MDDQLIFDVGAHRGEDTRYYLEKGFRVVAVEAHPDLAAGLRSLFPAALASGQLQVAECAVAETPGTVEFYVNDRISEWGTIRPNWAERNSKLKTTSRSIAVRSVTFAELLATYGVPYYLKVDIEGADLLCLEALLDSDDRPAYVSIESEKRSWDGLLAEFDLFERLGYDRFQLVDQMHIDRQRHPATVAEGLASDRPFAYGSSGLFGRDLPAEWVDRAAALERYRQIFRAYRIFGDGSLVRRLTRHIPFLGRALVAPWFDTHAALAVTKDVVSRPERDAAGHTNHPELIDVSG